MAEIDAYCGRFLCIFSRDGTISAMGDATAMRAIYFSSGSPTFIASHAPLLALLLRRQDSPEAEAFLREAEPRPYEMTFLPGFVTKTEGVEMLPANMAIGLATGGLTRIFPRAALPALTYDEAVSQAASQLADLADKLARQNPLVMSVTAGIDSRLTAAALCSVRDDVESFTYVRSETPVISKIDATIARHLTAREQIRHQMVPVDFEAILASDDYQSFRRIALYSVQFESLFALAYIYITTFPAGRVHLRSNIGELCRSRYHFDRFGEVTGAPVELMSELYRIITWAKKHPFIGTQFDRYISRTGFMDATLYREERALFYWEHLMPVWHGSLLLESDLSHDTVSLFNCRDLLDTFLAAPFEDSVSGRVMRGTIERLRPSMLDLPINPKEIPADLASEGLG